jgi:hypothetical protein
LGPWPIPHGFERLVREHVRRTRGEERGHLTAGDFSSGQSVRLSFPDGSFAFFEYAFLVEDRDGQRVAVFTEHCGYHVFPSGDLSIATLNATPQRGAGAQPARPGGSGG